MRQPGVTVVGEGGGTMRRGVAATTAVLLVLEGFGAAAFLWLMSVLVGRQNMSLAGADPTHARTGLPVAGVLLGLCLAGCGIVLGRAAVRDRPPGRFARVLLIICAAVHALLGAVTVHLVGRPACAVMMTVFVLVALSLAFYGGDFPRDARSAASQEDADAAGPTGTGPTSR